ncbi:MAG: tRNA (adenosine(37)-N6)-dimethylallyltransferase MiaA [Marinomonas sp.]
MNETPKTKSEAVKPEVALIAGPTASGKSAVAVDLALALEKDGRRGVVINADSAQVYADLRVLSARPSDDEMRGVEHRLFGAWHGAQACSAAEWAKRAAKEITDVHEAGGVPILVGGTGMYIDVLLNGIAPIPAIDPNVREDVRAMPVEESYAALRTEDPARAKALSPADTQRIARALEVVRSTERTLGAWQAHKEGGIADTVTLHPAILLPPREWLYERCDRRFAIMTQDGAIGEVKALLARSLDSGLPVMRAIGVPEIAQYLRGAITLAEASEIASQATRNYAKRQFTWFRNQPPEDWQRVESQNYDIEGIFASLLRH